MEIIFLGTGTSQGIPIIGSKDPVCLSADIKDKRLRSSVIISYKDKQIVIDTGPDFRQQMLRHNIDNIDAILYTHEHSDHTAGIDDIRPFCHKNGPMPVYAQERVMTNLRERFAYIFATKNRYVGAPSVAPHIVGKANFTIGNISITPISVGHGSIDILGYRIENFAYLTDVKTICDKEKVKLKGLNTLVVNALRIATHPTHYNLQEALDLIEEIKPQQAYITHISHKLGFHKEVEKLLPKNVFLACDNLKITV
ncbi:MAG: MBL fold metallo-hydrolase [Flavobacteriaceae bacterium]|nr:MBL fold metallo-hydrolase [Flavobacteriaceae bacterium]